MMMRTCSPELMLRSKFWRKNISRVVLIIVVLGGMRTGSRVPLSNHCMVCPRWAQDPDDKQGRGCWNKPKYKPDRLIDHRYFLFLGGKIWHPNDDADLFTGTDATLKVLKEKYIDEFIAERKKYLTENDVFPWSTKMFLKWIIPTALWNCFLLLLLLLGWCIHNSLGTMTFEA